MPGLREECGIFGIYNPKDMHCANSVYYGLYALQHRGQQSCGIAVNNDGEITAYKDKGLVGEVFSAEQLQSLIGDMAMGHVRYSMGNDNAVQNAQPLVVKYVKGALALAHNGNLTNSAALREELERQGAIFQTTSDSEIIAALIARERLRHKNVEDAMAQAAARLRGAFSLLVMSPRKMIALRDPHGFRPLCIGKTDEGGFIFASESCALDAVGASFVRDVLPGEMIMVDENGLKTLFVAPAEKRASCIFEFIYFARPDSVVDGISVHSSRMAAGRILASEFPVEADAVTGVPSSGTDAAIGYAEASGLPYINGFIKNSYIGRTFIQPTQSAREFSLAIKLNVLKSAINGKRIVVVDDSIVRGTTSARIAHMLKAAGAREVHLRISSPRFLWPCFFGTDIPTGAQLIAKSHTTEEIKNIIGADSLGFLPNERLHEILSPAGFGYCSACFTGEYPKGSCEGCGGDGAR